MKTFTRGFYIALMPSTGMLLVAIWKRVDQYGITERRYFLIILALWLAGVSIYYTVSRSRSIKLIPMTLCALAVVSFAGPLSAYNISLGSQRARVERLLMQHGLLADGALRPRTQTVSDSVAKELSDAFRYLLQQHGEKSVRPWIRGDIERSIGAIGSGSMARADAGAKVIMAALHVTYFEKLAGLSGDFFSFYAQQRREPIRIEGYTYAIQLSAMDVREFPLDSLDGVKVRATPNPPALLVTNGKTQVMNISLLPLLDSVEVARRRVTTGAPLQPMKLEVREGNAAALVLLWQVMGRRTGGKKTLTSLDGTLYIKLP